MSDNTITPQKVIKMMTDLKMRADEAMTPFCISRFGPDKATPIIPAYISKRHEDAMIDVPGESPVHIIGTYK